MADLYDHYKGVEPGSITSATSSLKTKVEQIRSKLGTLKSSLSDDIWKASAKATLLTAFDKIDAEVCEEILDKLAKADEIAGYVEQYNTAKSSAENFKSLLQGPHEDTAQATIDSWRTSLSSYEQTMQDCVNSISGLL